ncbi:3-ketoacyl-ACP reductase [Rhodocaloribacter litoris]|uniref:3-ketoacyl-ACP reductase n=1 Tax=Rhodocaloribacter litoris TaxID=2558931 RepID=UPI00142061FB|nr:3-ketoacyl-ACP reductase [Rhodocaloribacter litoris]QXD15135.1 3-ketoacyl-ACP reductase [Rhodocaloribacter litoris]
MKPLALITGGASGIGLGISEALAAEGYDLLVCGRRAEARVAAALDRLRAAGAHVTYVSADMGTAGGRQAVMEAARAQGRLHVLVNNAGMAPPERRDLLDASEESFDRVLDVNLKGPYFLTQAVARWMIAQRQADAGYRAAIINIGSVSATMASVERGEYCLSKAGLAMATRLWAVRLGPYGIPVYEVRPGIIRSDMTAGVQEKYDRLIADGLLVQARWGEPEDVGRAVAMLVRGDLPYSTGQVIMVDGGLHLERL